MPWRTSKATSATTSAPCATLDWCCAGGTAASKCTAWRTTNSDESFSKSRTWLRGWSSWRIRPAWDCPWMRRSTDTADRSGRRRPESHRHKPWGRRLGLRLRHRIVDLQTALQTDRQQPAFHQPGQAMLRRAATPTLQFHRGQDRLLRRLRMLHEPTMQLGQRFLAQQHQVGPIVVELAVVLEEPHRRSVVVLDDVAGAAQDRQMMTDRARSDAGATSDFTEVCTWVKLDEFEDVFPLRVL